MTRAGRWLTVVAIAAIGGIVVFGVLAWRAVTVTTVSEASADQVFKEIRERSAPGEPLLRRTADGGLERTRSLPEPRRQHLAVDLEYLYIVAYRPASGRLVRAEVPFWFFALKAPAAQLLVRDTGFDLDALGLTAADLEREGPRLILDETDAAGDRVVIWTQ